MATKKDKTIRKPRVHRDCHSQKPLHVPNATTSLRTILDRTGSGLPVNARVAKHTPLPPDGDDLEDFETGTAEYLDLVDVQKLDEKQREYFAEQKRKQKEEAERKKQEAFDAEVAKKVAEQLASANNP